MDMRELEAEVQRLVGYNYIVTSGVNSRGPHIDFNSGRRLLRIWIPRSGSEARQIAAMAKPYMDDPQEAAYKEMEYRSE